MSLTDSQIMFNYFGYISVVCGSIWTFFAVSLPRIWQGSHFLCRLPPFSRYLPQKPPKSLKLRVRHIYVVCGSIWTLFTVLPRGIYYSSLIWWFCIFMGGGGGEFYELSFCGPRGPFFYNYGLLINTSSYLVNLL